MAATFVVARLCTQYVGKNLVLNPCLLTAKNQSANQVRSYAKEARSAVQKSRISPKSQSLKERLLAPAQGTAFNLGKGLLLGASAFGIGSLCYYGLGLSSEPGAVEKSMIWPQYVRDRIKATYAYFGGSILITAASAYAVTQSPMFLNIMMKNSWLAIGVTLAAAIGSLVLVMSMPYSEGLNGKHLAWALYSSIMGAVAAPLCFLGGPILVRAAVYTAGVAVALSSVAACAPSERFLHIGTPLACVLGLVFASTLGSLFLSPTTALGAGIYSISVYGGLVLFSVYLVYDTQEIVLLAETYPVESNKPYDPINASISIYLDALNIFYRIAMLLAEGRSTK